VMQQALGEGGSVCVCVCVCACYRRQQEEGSGWGSHDLEARLEVRVWHMRQAGKGTQGH
jgi:hypothetical protein